MLCTLYCIITEDTVFLVIPLLMISDRIDRWVKVMTA